MSTDQSWPTYPPPIPEEIVGDGVLLHTRDVLVTHEHILGTYDSRLRYYTFVWSEDGHIWREIPRRFRFDSSPDGFEEAHLFLVIEALGEALQAYERGMP